MRGRRVNVAAIKIAHRLQAASLCGTCGKATIVLSQAAAGGRGSQPVAVSPETHCACAGGPAHVMPGQTDADFLIKGRVQMEHDTLEVGCFRATVSNYGHIEHVRVEVIRRTLKRITVRTLSLKNNRVLHIKPENYHALGSTPYCAAPAQMPDTKSQPFKGRGTRPMAFGDAADPYALDGGK